ncbi:MAG: hypothetical protein ACOC5D_01565 [Thermoplasmatota archaeon]
MDIKLDNDQKRLFFTFTVIFVIVLIMIILNLDIIDGSGKFDTSSGTATIHKEDRMVKYIDFVSGEDKEIRYSFNVIDGPNIDVFLLDEKNFERYSENERFNYIPEGSLVNKTSGQVSTTLQKNGEYYLVFDNGNDIYHTPNIGDKFSTSIVEWKVSIENNDSLFG